jgi:hypothetical protein
MTKIPILMRILNLVYEHVCSRKKIKLLWNLLKHIRIEKNAECRCVLRSTSDERTETMKEQPIIEPFLP